MLGRKSFKCLWANYVLLSNASYPSPKTTSSLFYTGHSSVQITKNVVFTEYYISRKLYSRCSNIVSLRNSTSAYYKDTPTGIAACIKTKNQDKVSKIYFQTQEINQKREVMVYRKGNKSSESFKGIIFCHLIDSRSKNPRLQSLSWLEEKKVGL